MIRGKESEIVVETRYNKITPPHLILWINRLTRKVPRNSNNTLRIELFQETYHVFSFPIIARHLDDTGICRPSLLGLRLLIWINSTARMDA